MKLLFLAALSFMLFKTSIYTLSFFKVDGSQQSFSAFQGRSILLVNIATGSDKVGQLAQLKQLQTRFGDSLVIVAFPSNSFGSEPRNDLEIKQFCDSACGPNFLIAKKGSVLGGDAQQTFQWLSQKSENGEISVQVKGDFQKCVIGRDGSIVGVFASSVSPLDQKLVSAIRGN